jgi:hypothetical protein
MAQKSEFNEKLPDQETIEDGRKGSLYLGLAIGAGIVLFGFILYAIFGKYIAF